MKLNIRISLLSFAAITLLQISNAEDFGDLRITVNSAGSELSDTTSTKSHFEVRLPDAEKIGYIRFSQKFYTSLKNGWKLGTHPVIETSKKGDDWNNTYRLDLELNPSKFKLGETGPSISVRNRWELRWKEGKGSEIFHRFRHQTKATWSIDALGFNSYSLADEIFYEDDKGKVSMNRIYPIMLGAKHGDKVKASYYLLYESKRSDTTSDWTGAYIVGTSLSF